VGAYSLVVVLELVEWIAVTSTVDLSMEPFVQLSAQELSSEDMKHFWANVSLARRSAIKMVVTCRDTVLHKPHAIFFILPSKKPNPDILGVVYGPHEREPLLEFTKKAANVSAPVRQYPDITHTLSDQVRQLFSLSMCVGAEHGRL